MAGRCIVAADPRTAPRSESVASSRRARSTSTFRVRAHRGRVGCAIQTVSALPTITKAALAAILLGSMLRAFFGAPAPGSHRLLAHTLLALTALCYAGGAFAVLATDALLAGSLLIVGGIEASCLAAWLVRGGSDDEDGGDGGGGGGGGGPGRGPLEPAPIDWAAFDRARRNWERPRATV